VGGTVYGWYSANSWRKIAIRPNCQCNTVTVRVFNFNFGSAWISYGLYQSTTGCFCPETSIKFWNYKTCQCECKRNCCFKKGDIVNRDNCRCQPGFITAATSLIAN
jgi:hypothetical protein